jgi:dihydrofolate reductase
MRKLIIEEFLTLEGFAAGPGNSVDFIPAATKDDRRFGREQLALMEDVDTILLGRVTYGMFAGYWPNAKGEEKAPWGSWPECRIVTADPAEEVAKLKHASGRNLVLWGSLSIAQQLMKAGLVDEYRLVVCPVVLGGGRPLFAEKTPIDLKLVEATPLDRGAVLLTYRPGPDSSMTEKEVDDVHAATR